MLGGCGSPRGGWAASARVVCPSSEPTAGTVPLLSSHHLAPRWKMLPAHGAALLLCDVLAISHLGRGKGAVPQQEPCRTQKKALSSSVRGVGLGTSPPAPGLCPCWWQIQPRMPVGCAGWGRRQRGGGACVPAPPSIRFPCLLS